MTFIEALELAETPPSLIVLHTVFDRLGLVRTALLLSVTINELMKIYRGEVPLCSWGWARLILADSEDA